MTEDVSDRSEPLQCEENPAVDREFSGCLSGLDVVSAGPDSDSGDSLFITQKPVPEAVRPRRPNLRSDSLTPQDLAAEREEDEAKSTTDEESEKTTKKTKKVYRVPKFRFSFLNENRRKRPMISAAKSKTFQVYAMGGYIRSVKELWERWGHGGDPGDTVPTVDVDGQQIVPISEEEEETVGDYEDIKVVEKKHLVISLNARCSQHWYDRKTRSSERRPSNTLNESQGEGLRETIRKVSKMKPVLTSASGTSDDEESLSKTQSSNERSNTERNLHKEKNIQLGDDSDATFYDPSPEKHLQINREADVAAAEPNGELFHMEDQSRSGDTEGTPTNLNLPKTDLNSESQIKKKKKKKDKVDHKSVEEEKEQSPGDGVPSVNITEEETHRLLEDTNKQDAPVSKQKKKKSTEVHTQEQPCEQVEEGSAETRAAETVRKEKKKKRKDVGAESVKTTTAAQPPADDLDVTADVPHTSMERLQEIEGCSENMETKPKKRRKKKKKKESASDDNGQAGEDGCKDLNFCDEAVTLETKTDFKVKKKKKKKSISDALDTSRTPEGDVNIQSPQKEKQKSSRTTCEDTIAPSNYSVSVQNTRTSSTLTADEEEHVCQIHEEPRDPLQSAAPRDVSVGISASANIRERFKESKNGIKKKRRKWSAVQECVERVLDSEETSEAGVQKKKKKKNDCELTSFRESLSDVEDFQTAEASKLKRNKKYTQRIRPDDAESQTSRCNSSKSVSPTKKKLKKKSQYVHDAETSHDERLFKVKETRETHVQVASPSSGKSENHPLAGVEKKKKIETGDKHLQEVGSLTKTTKIKACESKRVKRRKAVTDCSLNSVTSETFTSEPETASSSRDKKKKKSKKKLYNLKEDLFTAD